MEGQSYLLTRSAEFSSATLARISTSYTFHTPEHTKQVVRAAGIIGRASSLNDEQLDTVMIAAWFHDVGYCDGAVSHEERSAAIAVKMLKAWGAVNTKVADVSRSILATRLPQKPQDILGMVLCDADFSHLGSAHYEILESNLRKELEVTQGSRFASEQVWLQCNIDFLRAHHYFTDYGIEILDGRKKLNLNKLIKQLQPQKHLLFETH